MNLEFQAPLSNDQRRKLELACLAEYAYLLHDDVDDEFEKDQAEFLDELRSLPDEELIEEIDLDQERTSSLIIEMYSTYIEKDLRDQLERKDQSSK